VVSGWPPGRPGQPTPQNRPAATPQNRPADPPKPAGRPPALTTLWNVRAARKRAQGGYFCPFFFADGRKDVLFQPPWPAAAPTTSPAPPAAEHHLSPNPCILVIAPRVRAAGRSMYRARLRDWHETEGSPLSAPTGSGYPDKSLDSRAASDPKPPPPVMDGHAVLLADRCSPDTSHHKLRLPLLLPFLPFLLVATLWVGCLLTATIYALQLMEQLLEVLDPTPPDQFRNQPVRRSLFAETSTARLTRSGSFCCGWLWATSDSLAPEKPLSLLQRVRRFLRAPRRRLQLLLAESSTATLLEAPWLLLALWRGTPLRRGGRGRPPQLRRVTHDPKRAYYFVLARDELVWHATEAASSRGAMPAGSIRLDSIVEARPPLRLPPPPSASLRLPPPPSASSGPPPLPAPPSHPPRRGGGRC
jgi:hypothetical protein